MRTLILVTIFTAIVTFIMTKVSAWEKVRDLRMPKELRVVNEGVAHDDSHWYFSNQHFLYQTEIEPLNITMGIVLFLLFFHQLDIIPFLTLYSKLWSHTCRPYGYGV
jgi:hypothetical protein